LQQQEYARYLLALLDEETDADQEIEEDALYGYFQAYMPSGEGVEQTFEPLEHADVYLNRIKRIYEMLDPRDFEGDEIPGYFIGKQEEGPEEILITNGKQLVLRLHQLFKGQPNSEDAAEAAAYLDRMTEIVVLKAGEIRAHQYERDDEFYDAFFNLIDEHTDATEPLHILGEAYYSIACDYWVSYYLQWPRYKGLEQYDPLAPYFELYRLGYSLTFSDQKLYIGRV